VPNLSSVCQLHWDLLAGVLDGFICPLSQEIPHNIYMVTLACPMQSCPGKERIMMVTFKDMLLMFGMNYLELALAFNPIRLQENVHQISFYPLI